MPTNPILQIAPYLLAASQISRAVAEIVEGLQRGKMTPEQVRARWQAAADAVLQADAQWSQVDAAAQSGSRRWSGRADHAEAFRLPAASTFSAITLNNKALAGAARQD